MAVQFKAKAPPSSTGIRSTYVKKIPRTAYIWKRSPAAGAAPTPTPTPTPTPHHCSHLAAFTKSCGYDMRSGRTILDHKVPFRRCNVTPPRVKLNCSFCTEGSVPTHAVPSGRRGASHCSDLRIAGSRLFAAFHNLRSRGQLCSG